MPRIIIDIIKNDPPDNKFLECAITAKADFLITGNIKHFTMKKFHEVQIVAPREFVNRLATLFLNNSIKI